jgi:hypothetical protein
MEKEDEHSWLIAHQIQSQLDYIVSDLKTGHCSFRNLSDQVFQILFGYICMELQKIKDLTKEDYDKRGKEE